MISVHADILAYSFFYTFYVLLNIFLVKNTFEQQENHLSFNLCPLTLFHEFDR